MSKFILFSRSALTFHKAKHEAQEGQSLVCLVCFEKFKSKPELIDHVEKHNRHKPDPGKPRTHKCPQCNKSFVSHKDLKRHMVTHTKERLAQWKIKSCC